MFLAAALALTTAWSAAPANKHMHTAHTPAVSRLKRRSCEKLTARCASPHVRATMSKHSLRVPCRVSCSAPQSITCRAFVAARTSSTSWGRRHPNRGMQACMCGEGVELGRCCVAGRCEAPEDIIAFGTPVKVALGGQQTGHTERHLSARNF
jgi:hypothetical protein